MTEKLITSDLRFVWHPYTQMKDSERQPPLLIDRARGVRLYDKSGRWYYDTISSWWCNVHGHNHPHIKRAIRRQLDSLEHVLFAGCTHEPGIRLAEKLVGIAPRGLSRVFYSDNGSTAVEVALKMSVQYWENKGKPRKTAFVCLDYGYHGDTIGTMSVSGVDLFTRPFQGLTFRSYRVPSPYCYRCVAGKEQGSCSVECVGFLEDTLKKHASRVAGLILEPMVLGAGGMIVYPAGYLKQAARLARHYGVHLILDEVATGFGRTGKMFACEHAGVSPDFMCVSKGITGGYLPLAATLTTQRVARAFRADYTKKKTFFHGHTYTANPLGCAAGLASLEVFEREKTLGRVAKLEPLFRERLREFLSFPHVGDARSIGLIGALELVSDKKSKKGFAFENRVGYRIYLAGLRHGIMMRPLGNVVYFFLPLCVTAAEMDDMFGRLRVTLAEVFRWKE